MIKANELRIGNLVFCNETNPSKLHNISCVDFGLMFSDPEFFTGIPLTDEWLKRLGFVYKYNHNQDGDEHEWRQLDLPNGESIQQDRCIGDLSIGEYLKIPHVKFVHQLQNLYFALTGEELPIKELP